MKWETTCEMMQSAKHYASLCDDFAVKAYVDEIYWFNKNTADLLRAMSSRLKELENSKA